MSIITRDATLDHENPLLLCDQVWVLAQNGDEQSLEQLFALLGHEHPFVRWQASDALAKLVANTQIQQQRFWPRTPRQSHRVEIRDILAMAADALAADNTNLRASVVEALGQWHHTGSLPLLRESMNDSDATVRSAAAHALGINHDIESMKQLLDALQHDPSIWVRIAAAEALGNLRQACVVPALRNLVRACDAYDTSQEPPEMGNASECSMLRIHLVNAIGHLNHPQARDLLMEIVQGDDKTLIWYAARGLQHVGDAAALTVLKPLLSDETLLFDKTIASVAQDAIDAIRRREQGLGAWLRQGAYRTRRSFTRIWQTRFWRRA